MTKDVVETLLMLKKVNMKLNPKKMLIQHGRRKILRIYSYFQRNQSKFRKNKDRSKDGLAKQPKTNATGKRQTRRLKPIPPKAAEKALPCLDTLKKCTNKKDFYWTTEAEEAFQAMKKPIVKLPTLTAPKKEEELMVYLSAANEAISAILLVEREGRQALIHYVSRTLQGACLIMVVLEGAEYPYALRLNFANSNNDAEYEALLAGLIIATKLKGMDIVSPLLEAPRKIKYLIIAVDCFTKWIEAKHNARNQNKTTQEGGASVEEFLNVLWAYKTTPKMSNGATPFSLAYGTKAVILAEIGIPTRRTIYGFDKENEESLRMNLNLLEERREIETTREARRKQQLEKYYNQ
uniref:Reverse transcriptase/retrotransposon-derived protein RNase H-like domain-containing protein n=1 Tax=Tanacetum cinerariifolium TaxID=118510 RepID=A0A6L2JYZ5_TANCI|nr:hypothetical protein [Tanacetum cinerariifolium]